MRASPAAEFGPKEDNQGSAMKTLRVCDFRSRRLMLQKKDFALARGKYPGPTNLIEKGTWAAFL